MFKKSLATIVALLAAGSIAAIAGMFTGFPIVGGAAYCLTTINAVCSQTVPAGPTVITGNELIPADTQLTQGQNPQTVALTPRSIGAGPYVYNAPLTGASITLTYLTRRLILEPAGTIAALTVVFPAASTLSDNQLLGLCTTQIVSTLTLTAGSGTTIMNGPTALLVPVATGAASCVEWVYNSTQTKWYRTQ